MLKKIHSNTRVSEIGALIKIMVAAVADLYTGTDAKLSEFFNWIASKNDELTERLHQIKEASDLMELDQVRDNKFRQLYYLVKGATNNPLSKISSAAKALFVVLKHYGLMVISESYAIESTLINSLLLDLKKDEYQESIAALEGCTEAIAELDEAQKNFEANQVGEANSDVDTQLSASKLKNELMTYFNTKLIPYLNGKEAGEEQEYAALISAMDQWIKGHNSSVKKRMDN